MLKILWNLIAADLNLLVSVSVTTSWSVVTFATRLSILAFTNSLTSSSLSIASRSKIIILFDTRTWLKTLKHKPVLRYHPPSSTLLALIGGSAFAFNNLYPHKPYIFWKLNSSRLLLIPFKKIKILTRFRNEKLFVKVAVTVNLSPGQPKVNGRSQLRSHSLLNRFD